MSARSLIRVAVVLAVACGGPPDVPEALKRSWRLVSSTSGSTTPDEALDGQVVITATDYALGIVAPPTGVITSFTMSDDGNALVLADGSSVAFTLTAGASSQLTLRVS